MAIEEFAARSRDAERVLIAATTGDMYAEPAVRIQACAALLQHQDAIELGYLLERNAEATERIANALESRGGI